MSSRETPTGASSSSRGTAIPPEGTPDTSNLGNRIEDVDIALRQPTAGGFELVILQDIDNPEGDYKAQLVLAPQHDLPEPPVPDLASEIVEEIVEQFYENRFEQLERGLETAKGIACEVVLEDYYTTDGDE